MSIKETWTAYIHDLQDRICTLLEETDGTLEGERAVIASSEAGMVDGILFQLGVTLPVIGHRYARMLAASGGATP